MLRLHKQGGDARVNEHTLKVEGLEELRKNLENLVKKYPDRAGDLLHAEAIGLRKNVVNGMRQETNISAENKKSLGKIRNYKVSQVQGLGAYQYVELSAKSPHFHLVEHGHVLKTHKKKTIGFVPGKHVMENEIKKYQEQVPAMTEAMIETLLREEGFI